MRQRRIESSSLGIAWPKLPRDDGPWEEIECRTSRSDRRAVENSRDRNLARLPECLRTIRPRTSEVLTKCVKLFLRPSIKLQQQASAGVRAPAPCRPKSVK